MGPRGSGPVGAHSRVGMATPTGAPSPLVTVPPLPAARPHPRAPGLTPPSCRSRPFHGLAEDQHPRPTQSRSQVCSRGPAVLREPDLGHQVPGAGPRNSHSSVWPCLPPCRALQQLEFEGPRRGAITRMMTTTPWSSWPPSFDSPDTLPPPFHRESGGFVTHSCPTLATPWTVARQAPLSVGFSMQGY